MRPRWWFGVLPALVAFAVTTTARSDTPPPAVAQLIAANAQVYCGGQAGNEVALTFDDGPGPYTRAALDTLNRLGARATFFDIGKHLIRFPGLLRWEARDGAVGDHSWSHPDLRTLTDRAIQTEIRRTKQAIERRTGQPVVLFRPPYGAADDRVQRVVESLGLLTVLWSVSPRDTVLADPTQIANLVTAGARPGSIILLHENNNRGATVAALPAIAAALAAKGLTSVTVPMLLGDDPPSDRQLHTGPYGCGPTVTAVTPSGGSGGGSSVEITGSWLNLPQHVFFGEAPAAAFTAVSSTEVDAVAPAGSGTVDVTVVTHFGPSPTSQLDRFTYG